MNLKAKVEDVIEALAADGEVTIRGFGKFTMRQVRERDWYVPKTGETRKIPAHEVVAFKPSRTLTVRLAKGKEITAEITALEQEIARLEAKHGTGARPEWVGEDIGILMGRIRHLRAELTMLSG